jgi:hypothetical protein
MRVYARKLYILCGYRGSESKGSSDDRASMGGLTGTNSNGAAGRDLTAQIEACNGDVEVRHNSIFCAFSDYFGIKSGFGLLNHFQSARVAQLW